MNSKKLLKLLKSLNEEKRSYSAAECAETLNMGVSTFKGELKGINAELKKHGALIESRSGKGNGYRLKIRDAAAFDQYLGTVLPMQAMKERPDFTSREKRISYFIIRFLEKDRFLKSDDLAEAVGLSRTQLSSDLSLVRKELGSYGIELKSVPGYGLHASGEEKSIRACLASALMKNERNHFSLKDEQHLYPESVLVRIHHILDECFRENGYRETAAVMDSLGISLVVQYYRVKGGFGISYSNETVREIESLPEYEFAGKIARRMMQELHAEYSNEEICYMTVHLSTRTIPDVEVVSAEADELAGEMLKRLSAVQGIDLEDDDHFRQMLRLHTSELLKRLRYGTDVSHPLYTDVSAKLLEAYDCAAVFSLVIEERCGYLLSEEETGYYALHAEIALDRKRLKQKRILLVNAGNRSDTELLRYSFEKKFSEEIGQLDICDVIELRKMDQSKYDAVFSTVDIPVSPDTIHVPFCRISALISGKEKELVRRALSADLFRNAREIDFNENLFFEDLKETDPARLIHEMCLRIAEQEPVPEQFEDSLLSRMRFGKTIFPAGAVFLRPLERRCGKTFLSAAVLRHPVEWNGEKISMVFIAGFSRSTAAKDAAVLKALSGFLSYRKLVNETLSAGTFEALADALGSCLY